MSLEITNPIRVTGDKPDSERYIAPTVADRDQFVTDLRAYIGMPVYLLDDGGAVARFQVLTSLGPAVWEDVPIGTAAGPVGPVGPTGADSVVPGPDGPVGPTGTNGTNGADGAVGPVGPTGTQGEQGIAGTIGAIGPTGAPGVGAPDLVGYVSEGGTLSVIQSDGALWAIVDEGSNTFTVTRDGNTITEGSLASFQLLGHGTASGGLFSNFTSIKNGFITTYDVNGVAKSSAFSITVYRIF